MVTPGFEIGAAATEVRRDVEHVWSAGLQRPHAPYGLEHRRMRQRYLDATGHHTTLWPRSTFTFRAVTADIDAESYRFTSPATEQQTEKVPA